MEANLNKLLEKLKVLKKKPKDDDYKAQLTNVYKFIKKNSADIEGLNIKTQESLLLKLNELKDINLINHFTKLVRREDIAQFIKSNNIHTLYKVKEKLLDNKFSENNFTFLEACIEAGIENPDLDAYIKFQENYKDNPKILNAVAIVNNMELFKKIVDNTSGKDQRAILYSLLEKTTKEGTPLDIFAKNGDIDEALKYLAKANFEYPDFAAFFSEKNKDKIEGYWKKFTEKSNYIKNVEKDEVIGDVNPRIECINKYFEDLGNKIEEKNGRKGGQLNLKELESNSFMDGTVESYVNSKYCKKFANYVYSKLGKEPPFTEEEINQKKEVSPVMRLSIVEDLNKVLGTKFKLNDMENMIKEANRNLIASPVAFTITLGILGIFLSFPLALAGALYAGYDTSSLSDQKHVGLIYDALKEIPIVGGMIDKLEDFQVTKKQNEYQEYYEKTSNTIEFLEEQSILENKISKINDKISNDKLGASEEMYKLHKLFSEDGYFKDILSHYEEVNKIDKEIEKLEISLNDELPEASEEEKEDRKKQIEENIVEKKKDKEKLQEKNSKFSDKALEDGVRDEVLEKYTDIFNINNTSDVCKNLKRGWARKITQNEKDKNIYRELFLKNVKSLAKIYTDNLSEFKNRIVYNERQCTLKGSSKNR